MREYIIRNARQTDIPAMQECSMSVLGGDFYDASEIASFLTEFGTISAI